MILSCFPWISFMLKCHLLYFKKPHWVVRMCAVCLSHVLSLLNLHAWKLISCGTSFGGFGSMYVCVLTLQSRQFSNSPPLPAHPHVALPPVQLSHILLPSLLGIWLFSTPVALLSLKCRINHGLWGVVAGIYLPSQVCRDSRLCALQVVPCITHCLNVFPFHGEGHVSCLCSWQLWIQLW